MKISKTLAVIAMAVLPAVVFAQTTPPIPSDKSGARIDVRQANEQQHIEAGVKSCELNQKEAARLHKGQ